ncbi:Sls2 protein, partial [Teratosphaeria destructans]
ARQRREEAVRRTAGGGRHRPAADAGRVTLFDAGVEEHRHRDRQLPRRESANLKVTRRATLTADGFDDLTLSSAPPQSPPWDAGLALTVFTRVRSRRGCARHEFGRIYAALAPLYHDLARSRGHADAIIFRTYKDPEQQAQMLANLKRFAACDVAHGAAQREARLDDMCAVFEKAVLREFEQGYVAHDVTGRMRRYAHVLATINGGAAAVDSFISHHPVLTAERRLGHPSDCLDAAVAGMLVEQAHLIDSVFPPPIDVLTPLLSRICHDVIADYLTALFDEAHARGVETYVKAVSGTFDQALRLVASVTPTQASPSDFPDRAKAMVTRCFETHIDRYLAQELAVFTLKAEGEVGQWEKELSDQQATAESFFMSNINRQAAKRDFLSSFKKVVMMPVNVLPAFPLSMSSKAAAAAAASSTPTTASTANRATVDTAHSRAQTPTLTSTNTPTRSAT